MTSDLGLRSDSLDTAYCQLRASILSFLQMFIRQIKVDLLKKLVLTSIGVIRVLLDSETATQAAIQECRLECPPHDHRPGFITSAAVTSLQLLSRLALSLA